MQRDRGGIGDGCDGMGIAWGGGRWWMRGDVDVIVQASVMDAKGEEASCEVGGRWMRRGRQWMRRGEDRMVQA